MDKKVSCELVDFSHVLKNKKGGSKFLNTIGKFSFILIALFTTFLAKAQDTTAKRDVVDMATGMRSNGKIYVVVAVLCIILAGVFIYLVNLDKKIGKLEKEENSK